MVRHGSDSAGVRMSPNTFQVAAVSSWSALVLVAMCANLAIGVPITLDESLLWLGFIWLPPVLLVTLPARRPAAIIGAAPSDVVDPTYGPRRIERIRHGR